MGIIKTLPNKSEAFAHLGPIVKCPKGEGKIVYTHGRSGCASCSDLVTQLCDDEIVCAHTNESDAENKTEALLAQARENLRKINQ